MGIVSLIVVSLLDLLAVSKFIQSGLDLEQINQNYKTLVDHVDASLFLIHKDYSIIESNHRSREKTEKLFGQSILPGYDIRNYMPEPDRELFIKTFDKVLKGESFELDHKISFSNDIKRWYQMKIIPIKLADSAEVNTILFIIRNIEKEKNREESIKKNNKELLKVNAELDSFLYRSTHDLRAPLTSILGLVNVCQLEDGQSNLNEHLEMIKSSVLKLDNLIGDILDYSKNSNSEVKKVSVDFKAMIEEVFSTYSAMDFKNKISKEIKVENIQGFKSDPSRLKLIFNNLIANAYKYHNPDRESPYIQVRILKSEEGIELYVKDNGQGIDEEHQDKIFNIFFRAHFTSQGSGLGLYIVKEALEKIGGSIEVTSKVQKGSEFKICLPDLTELQDSKKILISSQD